MGFNATSPPRTPNWSRPNSMPPGLTAVPDQKCRGLPPLVAMKESSSPYGKPKDKHAEPAGEDGVVMTLQEQATKSKHEKRERKLHAGTLAPRLVQAITEAKQTALRFAHPKYKGMFSRVVELKYCDEFLFRTYEYLCSYLFFRAAVDAADSLVSSSENKVADSKGLCSQGLCTLGAVYYKIQLEMSRKLTRAPEFLEALYKFTDAVMAKKFGQETAKFGEEAPHEVYLELARVIPNADFSMSKDDSSAGGPLLEQAMVSIGGKMALRDFQQLASLVCTTIAKLLACDSVALMVASPETGTMWDVSTLGLEGEPSSQRLPSDIGFAGACVESKLPVTTMRATLDRRFDRRVDEHGAGRTTRLIATPMKVAQNGDTVVLGVLSACDIDKGVQAGTPTFSPEELLFLQALASQLAISLESCILYSRMQQDCRSGKMKSELAEAACTAHTESQLTQAHASILCEAFEAQGCTILLSKGRESGRQLVRMASVQREAEDGEDWGGAALGQAQGMDHGSLHPYCLDPLLKGRISVLDDVSTTAKEIFNPYKDQSNEPPIRHMICIPLWDPPVDANGDPIISLDVYEGLIGVIKIMNKGSASSQQQWLAVDKDMASEAQKLVTAQVIHVQHEQRLNREQMESRQMLDASVDLHVQTQLTGFVRSLHSNLCPKLECAFMAFLIPASPDQTSYSRFSGVRLGELPYEDVVMSTMEGVVSSVFRGRQTISVGQMGKSQTYNPRVDRAIGCDGRIEQILAVPVIPPGGFEPIAVLAMFNKNSGLPFSLEDANYAEQLSQISAVSLTNILARMSLQEQLNASQAIVETQVTEMASLAVELQNAHESTVVLKDPVL